MRGWALTLLAFVWFGAMPAAATAASAVDNVTITSSLICGTTVPTDRFIDWTVTVGPEWPSFVSVVSSNASVYGVTQFNDTYLMHTWHQNYFGPVTLTITYILSNGDPNITFTASHTVQLTKDQCTSVPSVRFESRCDGSLYVYVSNAASAGFAAHVSAEDSNGRYIYDVVVPPGQTQLMDIPAARASHVRVNSDLGLIWESDWQLVGCVGPAATTPAAPPSSGGTPAAPGHVGSGANSADTIQPDVTGPSPSTSTADGIAVRTDSTIASRTSSTTGRTTATDHSGSDIPTLPLAVGLSSALVVLLTAGVLVWLRRSRTPTQMATTSPGQADPARAHREASDGE
jgi:hypothetical protein